MFEETNDSTTMSAEPRAPWQHGLIWTKDDDDFLRVHWESGNYSAAVIGAMMKPVRSRNGIIGRAHRLSLSSKKRPSRGDPNLSRQYRPSINTRPGRPKRVGPRVRRPVIVAANGVFKAAPIVALPLFAENPSCYPDAVHLSDVARHQCRAIVSEDGEPHLCCGHPIHAGQNFEFCAYHLSRFTYHPRRRY